MQEHTFKFSVAASQCEAYYLVFSGYIVVVKIMNVSDPKYSFPVSWGINREARTEIEQMIKEGIQNASMQKAAPAEPELSVSGVSLGEVSNISEEIRSAEQTA